MKNVLIFLMIAGIFFIAGCVKEDGQAYKKITAEEGREMLQGEDGIILLDVRTKEEFDDGHIPGSILLPYNEISDKISDIVPDKETKIIVYCRSGNRSKTAAETLIDNDYIKVFDMGGIIDWPYEITR